MEKMVTDPDMDKVLCFVDRAYTKKAKAGDGGVGTETTIISPDVYRQAATSDPAHVKFVPVLMEKPLDPEHPLPTMFGTAKYTYMADPTEDEAGMMRLLNLCFGRPAYTRSAAAVAPAYLRSGATTFDTTVSGIAVTVRTLVKQEKTRLALASFEDFLDGILQVFEGLDESIFPDDQSDRLTALENAFKQRIDLMGIYAQVIDDLLRYTEDALVEQLHDFFLKLLKFNFGFAPMAFRDLSRLFTRELFVVTVALYIRRRRYLHLNDLLDYQYRLGDKSWRAYWWLCYGPELTTPQNGPEVS